MAWRDPAGQFLISIYFTLFIELLAWCGILKKRDWQRARQHTIARLAEDFEEERLIWQCTRPLRAVSDITEQLGLGA